MACIRVTWVPNAETGMDSNVPAVDEDDKISRGLNSERVTLLDTNGKACRNQEYFQKQSESSLHLSPGLLHHPITCYTFFCSKSKEKLYFIIPTQPQSSLPPPTFDCLQFT